MYNSILKFLRIAQPSESMSENKQISDISVLLSDKESGFWDTVFDALPDMVALIDLNNIIVKANKAMLEKLKIGDQAIIGNPCTTVLHDKGCINESCPHLVMLHDKKHHSIEMFEPKFGCFLNLTTTPLHDAEGNLVGALYIARDISTQVESDEKLTKHNNELQAINQNKDKFFGIVAHDLRSPFQGMLGFTDLILDEIDSLSKEEIKMYLERVRDSSESAYALLENLLDWSRLQTGRLPFKPYRFNINDNVKAIMSLLGSNAQSKGISLINNILPDFTVYADQQMVHSILLNLATNAVKFTGSGGSVSFDAKIRSSCENNPGVTCSCIHRCLEISITDTGVGIPPSQLEKMFNVDEHLSLTGTANEKGAGLGLLIVKEMVEKHGGQLTIDSQVGRGSVFSFNLPSSSSKQ